MPAHGVQSRTLAPIIVHRDRGYSASRCRALVPTIGQYEREALPDGKQPHFIHAGDVLFAANG